MAFTFEKYEAYKAELKECTDSLSVIAGSVKKMVETRISVLNKLISDYLLHHSNYNDFISCLLPDDISHVYTKSVNIFTEKKALIYSPTQVGKTDAMIRVVKDFISRGISVVISSDNKKDQMEQLFKRLTIATTDATFEKTFIVMLNGSVKKFFDEYSKHDYETFIICCLDNSTQISKVYETIYKVHEDYHDIRRLLVIHDEGDVTNKSRNVESIEPGVAKSHAEWIKLFGKLSNESISLKRIFVTATPENVIVIQKPDCIWSLDIPDNYVGATNIEFHSIKDFDNDSVVKILGSEAKVLSRNNQSGIILYVVERNKNENDIDNDDNTNQKSVFNYLKNVYNKHNIDVLSVYNSDGITVSFKLQIHRKKFVEYLVNENIKHEHIDTNALIIKKSKIHISYFYKIVQDIGCNTVLTIGKDLISRGISFVSSNKENPLTAITMIYKPGQSLHQVGLCQAIGRLTGTAQPKLKRKLYSTNEVSQEFLNFISNQKTIIDSIKKNGNKVDSELIEEIVLEKSKRTIDRKKLHINRDFKYWEETSSGSDTEYDLDGPIDGVKLTSLRKWINDDSLVGKMVRYLYDQTDEITLQEFKDGVEYTGTFDQFKHTVRNGRWASGGWGLLWHSNEITNVITLNIKIRKYLDDNRLI